MERKKLLFLSNLNNKDSKNDNSSSSNSLKEKFLDIISEDEKEKSNKIKFYIYPKKYDLCTTTP